MVSDNIAGKTYQGLTLLLVLPGMVIQWFMYMGVRGKRYGTVRQQTRLARSPIMTWVYAVLFWLGAMYLGYSWFFLDQ